MAEESSGGFERVGRGLLCHVEMNLCNSHKKTMTKRSIKLIAYYTWKWIIICIINMYYLTSNSQEIPHVLLPDSEGWANYRERCKLNTIFFHKMHLWKLKCLSAVMYHYFTFVTIKTGLGRYWDYFACNETTPTNVHIVCYLPGINLQQSSYLQISKLLVSGFHLLILFFYCLLRDLFVTILLRCLIVIMNTWVSLYNLIHIYTLWIF